MNIARGFFPAGGAWSRLTRALRIGLGQVLPAPVPGTTLAPDLPLPRRRRAAGLGHISLVGAGPGAGDLLTLRAVAALQDADEVYCDRLVDPAVLDLIPAHVRRVYVGKAVGAHAWPQDRICAMITASALAGHRVVRLKSGDPGIFGRAAEELAAARARGIGTTIVPGVTAASAAAAAAGIPLTERGRADALVIATGTCRDGDAPQDWGALLRPGTTLALYMAVRQAATISASLIGAGLDAATTVTIVASAATDDERILTCTLANLPRCIQRHAVQNPAILLVTRPKAPAPAGA